MTDQTPGRVIELKERVEPEKPDEVYEPEEVDAMEKTFGIGINKRVLLVTPGISLKNLHLASK